MFLYTQVCTQIKKLGDFMKDTQIHLRLSESNLELIKRVASQFDMTVSAFILAVVIPYCCKVDKKEN